MGDTGVLAGVGWTALMVAAGRAVETGRPERLVDDPFAAGVVRAAGANPPLPVAPGVSWPTTSGEPDADLDAFWPVMATYQGVRSKVFDDALQAAVAGGIDQVVIVAAGLDARAYRLGWPAGTRIFEIDTADVLAAKEALFTAAARADRRVVAADLRDDWPAALLAAGFDPARRSAWLAEGLLPFLPADAQDQLLARIGELAAAGSTIAVEHFAPVLEVPSNVALLTRFAEPWGVDVATLFPRDQHERPHPADRLAVDGWVATVQRAQDVAAAHGRSLVLGDTVVLGADLVTAVRG